MVESWHLAPGYVDLLPGLVRAQLDILDAAPVEVLFTAQSLPTRILDMGDLYLDQLAETATAVVLRSGVDRWSIAWQSAGRTPEPWIGPDVLAVGVCCLGPALVIVCTSPLYHHNR